MPLRGTGMKTLIIYYSRSGRTQRLAEDVQSRLGCGIERIQTTKDFSGLMGYFRIARESKKEHPFEIQTFRIDPDQYDLVVVGTPIWGGNVAIPVRDILARYKGHLRAVAFLATHGSSDPGPAFKAMEEACGRPPVATLGVSVRRLRRNAYSEDLERFIEKVRKAQG
jgi:flavodoxin